MNHEVMGVKEAAEFLAISERTLRRWIAAKRLPYAKIGGTLLFRRQALLEWLATEEQRTMRGEVPR